MDVVRTSFPAEMPAPTRTASADCAVPLRLSQQFSRETSRRGLKAGSILAVCMRRWLSLHDSSTHVGAPPIGQKRRAISLSARGAALLDREAFRRDMPPGEVIEAILTNLSTGEPTP
jgi:hypothetical protein